VDVDHACSAGGTGTAAPTVHEEFATLSCIPPTGRYGCQSDRGSPYELFSSLFAYLYLINAGIGILYYISQCMMLFHIK
jgi:hypothetical protein